MSQKGPFDKAGNEEFEGKTVKEVVTAVAVSYSNRKTTETALQLFIRKIGMGTSGERMFSWTNLPIQAYTKAVILMVRKADGDLEKVDETTMTYEIGSLARATEM